MCRIVISLILLFPAFCYSQDKRYPLGISLDYQFLSHNSFSVGIGIMHYRREIGTKEGWRIDFEFMPKDNPNMNNIYGLKIEGFLAYKKYFNFGYGLGYFKGIQGYKVVFNPEFGLGYKSIFIVYRRNLKVFGRDLDYINKDNLSVRLYIPIDRKWIKLKT